MKEQQSKNAQPVWLSRVAATVPRGHFVGAVASIALILCTGWVWSLNARSAQTLECEGTLVDLNDARALIANSGQWRKQYTITWAASKNVDSQVAEISRWLPRDTDWAELERTLRTLAASSEIKVMSVQKGDCHVGSRVGILLATCNVRGTYKSLCEFLNQLTSQSRPLACSAIKLQRVPQQTADANLDSSQGQCAATITLRIPYAEKGTVAGRLLSTGNKDAG